MAASSRSRCSSGFSSRGSPVSVCWRSSRQGATFEAKASSESGFACAFESSTYALVTTVYNLAIPVMIAVSNLIGTAFAIYDDDLQRDTTAVRWHVASSFFIMYGLRLVGSLVGPRVVALPLLHQKKDHAREFKLRGSTNALKGALIFTAFAGVFVASLTSKLVFGSLEAMDADKHKHEELHMY